MVTYFVDIDKANLGTGVSTILITKHLHAIGDGDG